MNHGLEPVYADAVKMIVVFLAIALIAFLANIIVKRIFLIVIGRMAKKTKNTFDDILLRKKVFHRIAHLAPAIVVYLLLRIHLDDFRGFLDLMQRVSGTYITIIFLWASLAFINALEAFFQTLPASKSHSIKGYLQVLKIILYSGTIIAILSILFKIDARILIGSLGASVAILILIFKDTILGLVASVQLSVYDMLRPGDWIEMPVQNANGIVKEISLTTVKIQNWDKTFTNIPTYSLVSNSFTNWRGMEEAEGRRVKRSINIDMKSVKCLSSILANNLSPNPLFKNVLDISKFIKDKGKDDGARTLTNLEVFRGYLESYLQHLPSVNPEMTLLVHYLQPTEFGLPLEIIFFTKDKDASSYEKLQCELYEYIFTVLPEFELKVFQL